MRFFIFTGLLLISIGTALTAQASAFWAHKVGTSYDIQYGEHERQRLDIYRHGSWQGPPKYFVPHQHKRKTLIYIHGGAWHGGNKQDSLWSILPYLEKGWQVVNVEYRVGGNTAPQAADDVALALRWIVDNAQEYAIDTRNIVVSGDSAGGHLALFAGIVLGGAKQHPLYLGDSLTIRATINWFGIANMLDLDSYFVNSKGWNYPRLWAGSKSRLKTIHKNYSPNEYVGQSTPPVMSVHGDADKVVPLAQSVNLHKQLDAAGVDNRLLVLKEGRHLGFTETQYQKIYQEIFRYLDTLGL